MSDTPLPQPTLSNPYDPRTAEPRLYAEWEASGAFQARPVRDTDTAADTYSICIPPPNVTGSLHIGHALDNTLQDILVRYHRMLGKSVLWQVGTDHAGIATQMVVERKLEADGKPRKDMGREEFLSHVWDWKAESGGRIIEQLKRLGASADWRRERFTMGDPQDPDDTMALAVRRAFVELYDKGLIYRDKRLVNWDPHFQTAISDLEVENREVDGHFWHFRYPLADGESYTHTERDEDGNVTLSEDRDYLVVATTRPETMLGDTAVAVHPDDERYSDVVGLHIVLPIVGRRIPIVADEYPDPSKGSGAVKITPAHDFNDYEVGRRAGVAAISILNERAELSGLSGPDFATADADNRAHLDALEGMGVRDARARVVEIAKAQGWLLEVEDRVVEQPIGDRSGAVIEPLLTDQWYVDAEKLAGPAMKAVERGHADSSTPLPEGEGARRAGEGHSAEGVDAGSAHAASPSSPLAGTFSLGEKGRGAEDDATRFVPANWKKTYDHWMENIQPWCISRQLWWGHRIPVWYGPSKTTGSAQKMFVATSKNDAMRQAKKYYLAETFISSGYDGDHLALDDNGGFYVGNPSTSAQPIQVHQDPDVLDTWFSSALWPFSTLGWPADTPELARFYPTSTLVTGFDIIFFWVARMMMMGLEFTGEVPFRNVFIHGLVLDEAGKKMSKSEGNVIDPLDLIDGIGVDDLVAKRTANLRQPERAPTVAKATRKAYPDGFEAYGADALRFTLAAMTGQGRNLRLSVDKIVGNRNFGTKLWNAARFLDMNGCKPVAGFDPSGVAQPLNQWIVGEASATIDAVSSHLQSYRFSDAADAAYKFAWNTFCDWFIEFSKPVLGGDDEAMRAETRATAAWTLSTILALLHPFMPFITEELWALTGERDDHLIASAWPKAVALDADTSEVARLEATITALRSVRSEMNVPPSRKAPLVVVSGPDSFYQTYADILSMMGRVEGVEFADAVPGGALTTVVEGTTLAVPLDGLIDRDAERARLGKAIAKAEDEIARIDSKLANERFTSNAPAAVVEEQHTRRAGYETEVAKLQAALAALG